MNCYHHTMNKISLALHLAAEWHDGQVDKAGKPYILHPLNLAMQFKDDENMFCIAMLHDVVEDCDISLEKIYNNFGATITAGVSLLTHKNKDSYFEYICNIKSTMVEEIKKADLKHNIDILRLKDLTQKDYYRLKKYLYSYQYLDNQISPIDYRKKMEELKNGEVI